MIRIFLLALGLSLPQLLVAQEVLPGLYDVTGVAANDVLNIRAAPSATASQIGQLAPGAKAVEVVALSAGGGWGQVNTRDLAGWVAMRHLKRTAGPDWFVLQTPLACRGTEPFWSMNILPRPGFIDFSTPEEDTRLPVATRWPGASHRPVAALSLEGKGVVSLRAAICSDGMSDHIYGITVDLFLTANNGPVALTGCCTLQP